MPRLARIAPGGFVFHVLKRPNAGATIFGDDADYAVFERVMTRTLEQVSMRVLAYCVMPHDRHLILWARGGCDLARFMQPED